MARRRITRELYDRLLEAYREKPGNASHAARHAGCDRRTAKRGWEEGWNTDWGRPVQEVIREEINAARAERLRAMEEDRMRSAAEREQARADAIQAASEEGKAAAIARANAIAAGGLVQSLLRSMFPLARNLQQQLENAAPTIDLATAAKLLGGTAQIVKQGNEAIRAAFELERIRLGEPMHTLTASADVEEVTPEEAVEELLGIERTIRRALAAAPNTAVGEDGEIIIDIPEEAYEEEEAEVLEFKEPKRKKR